MPEKIEVLREMYRKGDITTEEFLKRVAAGRFDHGRLEIENRYRQLFNQCREG